MSDYAQTVREHARLTILRFVEDAPGYETNVSILATVLPGVGIRYTRDQVVAECQWLREQGLVTVDERPGDLVIVTGTQRGTEVARGVARHPGVQRRRPGA